MTPLVLLMVAMARAQDTTPDYTVTYNPGQDCLPYDGSVVPDCKKFVNPITKEPYYHEHSFNCSRFWECGPSYETCLFECAPCQRELDTNPLCNGQWALSFDVQFQYPVGPVCSWPSDIDCSQVCDNMVPRPECCSDDECLNDCPGSHCSTNFECIYEDCQDGCSVNSDCEHYYGLCNIPPPHTEDTCQYCAGDECKPGCSSNDNCQHPAPICDLSDHTCKCLVDSDCDAGEVCNNGICEADVCDETPDCDGYDMVCNAAHDNCFYCGADDCDSNDGCCPGCHDSGLNCEYPAPICDLADHTCKCNDDGDCHAEDFCNTESGKCEPLPVCVGDVECEGYDMICNAAHDNCFYCGKDDCDAIDGCCPGCHDSGLNCEYPAPICDLADHTCKCNDDGDCHAEDFCNTESGKCEPFPVCVDDVECEGYDMICNAAYDNCFYCGADDCEAKDGCCPGCHDSGLNCEYPAPICDLSDHTCKCNDDGDCHAEDFCNTESGECELRTCSSDEDCNLGDLGECDVANTPHENCFYCDTGASPSICKPGCNNNYGTDDVPYCPAGSPECNVATHECSAASGSTLLTRIVVTTESCADCSSEGAEMRLTGLQDYISCHTNKLDHAGVQDYEARGDFFTVNDDKEEDGWGGCYESALKGKVRAAEVTWLGSGTWTVDNICFDWDDSAYNVWVCTGSGLGLTEGQMMNLECSESSMTSCP